MTKKHKKLILNIVHIGENKLNTIITSKEAILEKSRDLLLKEGVSALSIRSLANVCNVSIGTIYNYFDSKSDLVSETVESIWKDIFAHSEQDLHFQNIEQCIIWLYQRIAYGLEKYPDFFELHAFNFIGNAKPKGKQLMLKTWDHILEGLNKVLSNDPNIRANAFNKAFTKEKCANVLFALLITSILKKEANPNVVLEIVHRVLY